MRFRLRYLQHDLELTEGEFVVGRNASCQLSLDDPLVSRRHASFRVTGDGVSVEDLQSRNGVIVNGQRIEGRAPLTPGDRMLIGSQEMTLLVVDDQPGTATAKGRLNMTLPKITPATPVAPAMDPPRAGDTARTAVREPSASGAILAKLHASTTEPGRSERTSSSGPLTASSVGSPSSGSSGSQPGTPFRAVATPPAPRVPSSSGSGGVPSSGSSGAHGPVSRHPPPLPGGGLTPEPEYELTMIRRADAFTLLAGVAEKALAMGRAVEAERILASPLGDVIEASRAGKRVIPSLVDQAARFSAKLATATGKGAWADYVIELYSAQKRPCPAPVIDELYNALRRVTAIDLQRLREYIEELRSRLSTFGPAERFLFQRLEGLERLAALR